MAGGGGSSIPGLFRKTIGTNGDGPTERLAGLLFELRLNEGFGGLHFSAELLMRRKVSTHLQSSWCNIFLFCFVRIQTGHKTEAFDGLRVLSQKAGAREESPENRGQRTAGDRRDSRRHNRGDY